MEQVTGRTFGGEALVETDGTTFMDCDFDQVQLVYRGGEHPLFESCRFGLGVRWSFLGPALKTIQLLQRIRNAEGGENFVADIFQAGKFFADEEPSAGQTLPRSILATVTRERFTPLANGGKSTVQRRVAMLVFTVALLAATATAQPALDTPIFNPAPQGPLCPETAMSLARKMGTRPPHAIPLSKLPPAHTYMAVDRRIDKCPAPMTMTEYRNPRGR